MPVTTPGKISVELMMTPISSAPGTDFRATKCAVGNAIMRHNGRVKTDKIAVFFKASMNEGFLKNRTYHLREIPLGMTCIYRLGENE